MIPSVQNGTNNKKERQKKSFIRSFLIIFFILFFSFIFAQKFIFPRSVYSLTCPGGIPCPKWRINIRPVCPSGMYQTKPLRMFRIRWPKTPPAGEIPHLYFDCVNTSPSTSSHTMDIEPEYIQNGYQNIYVGLEDKIRDGKEARCSEGVALEPYSISPTNGNFVIGTFMNPQNWMIEWKWDKLPSRTYMITYKLPASMCAPNPTSTPKPTKTPTPTIVCLKAKGDANCDGLINNTDFIIGACEFLGEGICASPPSTKTADFNSDNKVDLIDFEIWRRNRT